MRLSGEVSDQLIMFLQIMIIMIPCDWAPIQILKK